MRPVARHSLQWRLTLGLVAAILLTGSAAALFSFTWALRDANEILDGALVDTAALIANGQMALPDQPAKLPGSEPENETLVVPLRAAPAGGSGIASVLAALPDGMHTVRWQERSWRVLVRQVSPDQRVGIAQWTEARDEIARHSALRTLIPLLLLVPVLGLVVREVVRRTLAPVASLGRHVDSSAVALAAQLPDLQVPLEIEPFVQSIRRLLQELTQALEQQRRFVANAAHELRSPMAALQLQAANLERVSIGEEAISRLGQLQHGIHRMQHLLEQLLAMARSEAGSREGQPVRLSDVAREVLAQCVPAAQEREIDLGMDRADSQLHVTGTSIDLVTLLRNVVENAVKYSPPGTQVTVSVYREGDEAVLAVEDEGVGIPEPHRARAFEPFYRVPGAEEPGSGLGLAIVAAVAKRLGGHAELRPRPGGQGLRFEYRQQVAQA
ncbi:sensor histidine kinase [Ramlibacter sp. MMS24-I3-19]|uniref:sensor histidine kinase n=1 Tax=Ramlibacter sp. MMS24-I3-19 TaxID=3416606 RepID=UPI003D085AFE